MKAKWLVVPAAAAVLFSGSALAADMSGLPTKAGCIACHKIDKKLVGPSWKDVAARYKGKADAKATLIKKIETGGKGNWTKVTGGVPMPPYGPRTTAEERAKLVDFILGL
jgi:cytochrome c